MTPLRSPAFRLLWCSTLASAGAQGMERTLTAWLSLLAGGMLPSLLLGLAAGTIADRTDRPRQLLAVAGGSLALMAALSWLVGAGAIRVWQVVAISFASGCLHVFDTPARQALVLDTVPRPSAANAMALNALAGRLAMALGAFAGGALIPAVGVGRSYLAVAALYALTAVAVVGLRVPRASRAGIARPPFRRALRDAARLIVDIPAVRTLMIAGIACEVFAFSHGSALPVFAQDVLAAGAGGLGTLNAAVSVGGTIAVLLLSFLPGRLPREPLLGGVFVVYGLSLIALASAREVATAAAILVVTGICAGGFDVLQQTLIQMAVPEEQRGRAVGVWVLGLGSAPAGHLEMGALVATLGAPGALLINGSLTVVAAATLLARAPTYRPALRRRPSPDPS
jgi:predicted MFS family arabinose efflux permease